MISFLKKMVSNNKIKSSKKVMDNVKEISELSEEVNIKKEKLEHADYKNLLEVKKDMYFSLSDFLEFFDNTELGIDMFMSKCKHITELNNIKSSTIEVYTIVEDNHIVLCPDTHTCEKHKGYKGDKIKITTIRRSI